MKPVRSTFLGLLAAVLVLAPGVARPREGGPAAAPPVLVFEPHTVRAGDGRQIAAELGWLTVPESRSRPDGAVLRLAVLRLRSTATSPGPPIVYLSGGPGGSGTGAVSGSRLPLFLALREVADVIALDQRGTGQSRPSLACRESWVYPLDRPGDREAMVALAREKSRACAARLRAEGIDLAAYNTEESAADLEDLRRAVGARSLSLLGTSYGTQLALAAVRRHEGSFHRMVLAGVEAPHQSLRLPMDLERQLAQVSRLVQADPELERALPDLRQTLRTLLLRLEEKPVEVEVSQPLAGRSVRVAAGRFDLEAMVAQQLSTRAEIAALPAKIRAMTGGNFGELGTFALGMRRGWLGSAMPYAVDCATGVPEERWRRIQQEAAGTLLRRALDFPFPEICEAWGVPDLGPAFRAPVRSRVPALLLSGTLDVRTPPANAEEVLAGLPNGRHLLIEGAGHGDDLLVSSPEIARAVLRFLQGKRPERERIVLPRLSFAAPTP